jgi:hypothetical protein
MQVSKQIVAIVSAGIGVGHASMIVHGSEGSIHISFWPAANSYPSEVRELVEAVF